MVASFVFAYAAISRIILPEQRKAEECRFALPEGAGWVIVAFELWLAWGLANRDPLAAWLSVAFIVGATLVLVARHPRQVMASVDSLGCYQASAPSVALHLFYVVFVLLILYRERGE